MTDTSPAGGLPGRTWGAAQHDLLPVASWASPGGGAVAPPVGGGPLPPGRRAADLPAASLAAAGDDPVHPELPHGRRVGPSIGRAGPRAGGAARDLSAAMSSGVATWLPEGRWATAADGSATSPAAPEVPADDPAETGRRRGRRQVAATRVVAWAAGWPRQLVAVLLLLTAAVLALRPGPSPAVVAPAPPGAEVVVAARDLPAGTALAVPDLRTVAMPTAVVPAGAARQPGALLGRVIAGPVRRGEPVTDVRLVGPGLTAGLDPGTAVAVPVRLSDPQAATLVRAGDRVDVLGSPVDTRDGTPGVGADAVEVAAGVRVLAVLGGDDPADGTVVVVAASPATARRLAGAAATHRLTVTVRPP